MKIIIALPLLSYNDAICNDVRQQAKLLKKAGFDTVIYASESKQNLTQQLIPLDELKEFIKDQDNLLLYHHGVYWEEGNVILREANCTVWLKYHNITPSHFFKDYDLSNYYATQAGELQTRNFVWNPKIEKYIGDSSFNCDCLKQLGVNPHKLAIIPPLMMIEEYSKANIDSDLLSNIQNGKKHFLTVGRVVPNKGHSHLIQTIRNYVNFFGPEVQLHIIGSLSMQDKRYYYELERLINRFHLGEQIIFHQNVNFDQMHTYYSVCDAFLMMSEHEGFCVPIAESQFHELPIIALNRGAVEETLGPDQIIFDEPEYYDFAVALHRVAEDQSVKEHLTTSGSKNFHRYRSENILQQLLSLF